MSKKNRRALRRTLLSLSMMLVVAFAAIGGTLAWLTDTATTVTNTFTLGKVDIDMDEAKVNEYGVAADMEDRTNTNSYKLLPGQEYSKDPIIHVQEGSEDCYLFVKIVNQLSEIETKEEGKTIADQLEANDWVLIPDEGVYYYNGGENNGVVSVGDDVTVFTTFTLDGDVSNDDIKEHENKTIIIEAYAVQADNIDDAPSAWAYAKSSF